MDARKKRREALICLAAVCILTSGLAPVAAAQEASCAESARLLRYACQYETAGDYHQITARCLDDTAPSEDCLGFAESRYDEAIEECDDVLDARLDLCEALDDAVHEPRFGSAHAADFVDPREIGGAVAPNPYFPLAPGNRWVYEGGDATITVTVTDEIKRIQGIDCVTVTDVESEDGVVIEDTDDWFAQDVDGNVWYCGETSRNFEVFDNDQPVEPELVDVDGSWKSGRDGAEAGILIPASPEPGAVIRQEVFYGDAEDAIEIVSITASEDVPGGSCADDCLQTRDFTPLEPEAEESKYYAPGIGLILEVEGDERVELVEFQGEGQ